MMGSNFGAIRPSVAEIWASASAAWGGADLFFISLWGGVAVRTRVRVGVSYVLHFVFCCIFRFISASSTIWYVKLYIKLNFDREKNIEVELGAL
jgi:hypothetical protein